MSADGLTFIPEAGFRLTARDAGFGDTLAAATTGPALVRLPDGSHRMYFSDLPRPGDAPGNHRVKSALSPDMLTWRVEDSVLPRLDGVQLPAGAPQAHRATSRAGANASGTDGAMEHGLRPYALADGSQFRVLTVVNQWSRHSPILEAASSMSGRTVGAALDRALVAGHAPRSITLDHGTEFVVGARGLGLSARHAAGLHSARKTRRQRLHRVVQRTAPRRLFERAPIHVDRRCAGEDRRLAGRARIIVPLLVDGSTQPLSRKSSRGARPARWKAAISVGCQATTAGTKRQSGPGVFELSDACYRGAE